MIVCLDTETTGLDSYHGARPFLVTTCDEEGNQLFWEWSVDTLTRKVQATEGDLEAIGQLIDDADQIIGHNLKFDVAMLTQLFQDYGYKLEWDWDKTQDTLIASHVLYSNLPHDLTSVALQYCGVDILPYERALEAAVKKCRSIIQQAQLRVKRGKDSNELARWRIAVPGLEEMPSLKGEKAWHFDYWLPRAYALHQWNTSGHFEWAPHDIESFTAHTWHSVLSAYANVDTAVGLRVWQAMEPQLRQKDLWEIYRFSMQLPPVFVGMEQHGVTSSKVQLEGLKEEFQQESQRLGRVCVSIGQQYQQPCEACNPEGTLIVEAPEERRERRAVEAGLRPDTPEHMVWDKRQELGLDEPSLFDQEGCDQCGGKGSVPFQLQLPRNGVNNSLRTLCFELMQLPPVRNKKAKSNNPTLDSKSAIPYYLEVLPQGSPERMFIKSLAGKRKVDTAVSYLQSYERFALPLDDEWYVLHPSYNPTGTDTLRVSSNNPNATNISKKDEVNLRRGFGPRPGRVFVSKDYSNLEVVLPAYRAEEEAMINLFEQPNKPPYFGSIHLLNCHVLWPKEFERCLKDGVSFKDRYKATLYQDTKNGWFAIQYGAQVSSGTADRTFKQKGAQLKLMHRYGNLTKLNQFAINFANAHGYIETFPDKTVNPRRGYPLYCTKTEYGKILPTVPLSYMIQGTACWIARKALIRCQAQLDEWRNKEGYDGYMVLYVHDEIVFDLPRDATLKRRTQRLKELMQQSGDDVGIPLQVSVTYNTENWASGEEIDE